MNINSALIIQIIVFCLLVWFTVKFVWPPIAKALDERASKIAEGLAAAERGKSDFEQAEKRVAELMAEGRDQVAEIITNAEKRASQSRPLMRLLVLLHRLRPMWSRKLIGHAKLCVSRWLRWQLKVLNRFCAARLMPINMPNCWVC